MSSKLCALLLLRAKGVPVGSGVGAVPLSRSEWDVTYDNHGAAYHYCLEV